MRCTSQSTHNLLLLLLLPVLLLLLLLQVSCSSTRSRVWGLFHVAETRCLGATDSQTHRSLLFVSPSQCQSSTASWRCSSSSSSYGRSSLTATTQGPPEEGLYRLLGGGLVLSPTDVFALAARRLLQQQLHRLQQQQQPPSQAAAAAAAVAFPITVEGGKGGDGALAFLRLRAAPRSGAAGGCGGRGGCVILHAVGGPTTGGLRGPHKTPLLLRDSGVGGCWKAAAGGVGGAQNKRGANGEDLLLGVLPNTLVVDVSLLQQRAAARVKRLLQQQQQQWQQHALQPDEGEQRELQQQQQRQKQQQQQREQQPICCVYLGSPGEALVVARGGTGGRGNAAFVSNSNRHPLVGEYGSPGEGRKLLLLPAFADFVVAGRVQSGKSTLLRSLACTAAAAAAGAAAFKEGAAAGVTEAVAERQQQTHRTPWLPAAVPPEVWVPTTEPQVAVIPGFFPQRQQQEQQHHHQQQQEQQQHVGSDLEVLLRRSFSLAAAAPVVALDTPGLLPPAATEAPTNPAAAAAAATAAAIGAAGTSDLLRTTAALEEYSLRSLSSASGVLFVVEAKTQDPAEEFWLLQQELLQQNAALAGLPALLVLNKTDYCMQQQQQHVGELVERVKRQTGLTDVHAVSALKGFGLEPLLAALRRASGIAPLSQQQQQLLLSHYCQQQQQQQQQQQHVLEPSVHRLAFLTAYAAAAAAETDSMPLYAARELQQQQQQVRGASLLRRPAAAPPLRVASSSSSKKQQQQQAPTFPSFVDPYRWQLREVRGQAALQRLLQQKQVLYAAPGFVAEHSASSRCFELEGPLVSLLTDPVKFNSEEAKLRLYRQLSALGIIERLHEDYGASEGNLLSVGPVLLQLLPLPLLRHPSRRKQQQQQSRGVSDLWEMLRTDGLPLKASWMGVDVIRVKEQGGACTPERSPNHSLNAFATLQAAASAAAEAPAAPPLKQQPIPDEMSTIIPSLYCRRPPGAPRAEACQKDAPKKNAPVKQLKHQHQQQQEQQQQEQARAAAKAAAARAHQQQQEQHALWLAAVQRSEALSFPSARSRLLQQQQQQKQQQRRPRQLLVVAEPY
ncbi:hypothetical protein Esti_001784 [Eimeria stiedai]